MNTQYKYLHFVAYKMLGMWDVKRYGFEGRNFSNAVRLRDVLCPFDKPISTEVLLKNNWAIISKINFSGDLFLRDVDEAKTFKGKLHIVDGDTLIYSKINVRHGCIYYHSEGEIPFAVSSEYPAYKLDTTRIIGSYLVRILQSSYFKQALCVKATGISKARVKPDEFLDIQIPLPSLAEQQALVDAYNHNLQQATELEQQAENGEKEIENTIMQRLGINIPQKETDKKGLSLVSYRDVQDRWDLYNAQTSIFAALAKATYKAQQIGSIYNFITRGWKKTEDKFRYIELGSVNAADGIMSASELLVKDAPSRATQKVSEGDLILGTTRPYLKKFAIVPQEFADCVCSSGFQVIANNSTNNLQFLYEYLKTPAAIAQYEYFMTGALYPAITNADLKKVEIPLPPLDVQAEIVAEVQAQRARIAECKTTATTLRQEAMIQFERAIFE